VNGECDTNSRHKRYRSTVLFWVITQRVVVISNRRSETHYRSNSEGSRSGGSLKSRIRNTCRVLRAGAEGKRPLERLGFRWKENVIIAY